jgi:hypothetical protein
MFRDSISYILSVIQTSAVTLLRLPWTHSTETPFKDNDCDNVFSWKRTDVMTYSSTEVHPRNDQVKEYEMGRASSTNGGEEDCI